MWRAISAGDARYVELLLSARVAVAPPPDDPELLPLHHICKKGFVSCAEAILRSMQPKDCSMWLTKLDANGMSPVHIAAAEGHNALIALLLQYGASPALNSRSAGTPLHVALLCREWAVECA
jgi:ankyrin repeat protein